MQRLERFVELIDDWSYIAQHEGRSSSLLAMLKKMTGLLYHRNQFVVMACSLLEPLPDLRPKIELEIRAFEPSDLSLLTGCDFPSDIRLCAQRLKYGHLGVLALAQDQVAGYAWTYTSTQTALDRIRFDLSSKEVLFLSDYTVPTFRGLGVHTAMTLRRLQIFQELGYQNAFACVDSKNGPSLAVYRKVGGYPNGVIQDLGVGPWRRLHRSL